MMATATVSFAGPRYAPEDPTLPKPWKGLVDAKTGYLYFWNPETNVTQYEKPAPSSHTGSAPPQKLSSAPGDNVPPPLTSFEATGFPSELLRETHEHHHRPPPAIVSPIQKHERVSGGRFLLRRGRSIPISLAEESKARTAFWK
ncbi:hypothetical protein ACSBR1_036305 [Camellia fascicularis]